MYVLIILGIHTRWRLKNGLSAEMEMELINGIPAAGRPERREGAGREGGTRGRRYGYGQRQKA